MNDLNYNYYNEDFNENLLNEMICIFLEELIKINDINIDKNDNNQTKQILQTTYNNIIGDDSIQNIIHEKFEYDSELSQIMTSLFKSTQVNVFSKKNNDYINACTAIEEKDDTRYNIDQKMFNIIQKIPALKNNNFFMILMKSFIRNFFKFQENKFFDKKVIYDDKIKKFDINCRYVSAFIERCDKFTLEEHIAILLHEVGHNTQYVRSTIAHILDDFHENSFIGKISKKINHAIDSMTMMFRTGIWGFLKKINLEKKITALLNYMNNKENDPEKRMNNRFNSHQFQTNLTANTANIAAKGIVGGIYLSSTCISLGFSIFLLAGTSLYIASLWTQRILARRNEINADAFLKNSGYEKHLISAFEKMNNFISGKNTTFAVELEKKKPFFKRIFQNSLSCILKFYDMITNRDPHPKLEERIERMHNL